MRLKNSSTVSGCFVRLSLATANSDCRIVSRLPSLSQHSIRAIVGGENVQALHNWLRMPKIIMGFRVCCFTRCLIHHYEICDVECYIDHIHWLAVITRFQKGCNLRQQRQSNGTHDGKLRKFFAVQPRHLNRWKMTWDQGILKMPAVEKKLI